MTSPEDSTSRKVRTAALWTITVLQAVMMLLAGGSKFTGMEFWTDSFVSWGYPAPFALVIGSAEMVGAVLLLVPRLAAYSALFLGAIMTGALVTVVVNQSSLGVTAPILNMAGLAIIVGGRWGSRRKF